MDEVGLKEVGTMSHADICILWYESVAMAEAEGVGLSVDAGGFELEGSVYYDISNVHKALTVLTAYARKMNL